MKPIKFVIFSLVIISMTVGGSSLILGQDRLQFSGTYTFREFMAYLDDGDPFFTLVQLNHLNPEDARLGTCTTADAEVLWAHLHSAAFQPRIPENLRFAWGWDTKEGTRTLYALRESDKNRLPGRKDIQSVALNEGQKSGSWELLITFSEDGAKKWAAMTRENIKRNIAIVVDGKVVTAPLVQDEIKMGKCLISGNYNREEASEIKVILEGQ